MFKFRIFRAKCAATVATVATIVAALVATLFPQSSNTCSNTHDTPRYPFSPPKWLKKQVLCSNSSNTFPNSFYKKHFLREQSEFSPSKRENDENRPFCGSEIPSYGSNEYDSDDLERYLQDCEDMYNDIGWSSEWSLDYDNYGRLSWEQQAVDEAIADEEPGQYPAMGDIPF